MHGHENLSAYKPIYLSCLSPAFSGKTEDLIFLIFLNYIPRKPLQLKGRGRLS